MKKQFVALLLLFFCAGVIHAADNDILEQVESSARSWLELVDNKQYTESWNNSSAVLREQMSEPDWVKSITATRAPLGSAGARYIATAAQTKSWPKLPGGEYVVLQFYATFSNKGLAMETIVLAKQQDEAWLVADYVVE